MKINKKIFSLLLVVTLCLGCGITALAKTTSFTKNGITANATLTCIVNTGGAATAITSNDVEYAFAQVVACKSDGTYLTGSSNTSTSYVTVTHTYSGSACKKFRGVHAVKDSVYKPLASYNWYIDK